VSETHIVHVRVNDAARRQPTPVRIRFSSLGGEYFAPLGRLAEFATTWSQDVGGNLQLGDDKYAYIDGTCEIRLPSTPVIVEVSKGPEYTPISRSITLGPGKLTVRLEIERWINLRSEGWYSGDCRAHFLTPQGALLEGAAEGLAVVNLLAEECELPTFAVSKAIAGKPLKFEKSVASIPNILAFSGQRPALETPGHMVVVNTHNRAPFGSVALLNCHRVVYPLSFGLADHFYDWTLADWCDQCHRKRGLVVWTELSADRGPNRQGEFNRLLRGQHGERLANLILGKIDALEFANETWRSCVSDQRTIIGCEATWYLLLNAGFRVPLVGSSGKSDNKTALGAVRTYAFLGSEEFTYGSWIEAIRGGRTFVTRGPLLNFMVNDRPPGAIIDLAESGADLRVSAQTRGFTSGDRLEVVCNGVVVAETTASEAQTRMIVETKLPARASCWLAIRCMRRESDSDTSPMVVAHSSPVYIQVANRSMRTDPIQIKHLVAHLDKTLEWLHSKARFENDRHREKVNQILLSARAELEKRGAAS
jgi:hypothetical protein